VGGELWARGGMGARALVVLCACAGASVAGAAQHASGLALAGSPGALPAAGGVVAEEEPKRLAYTPPYADAAAAAAALVGSHAAERVALVIGTALDPSALADTAGGPGAAQLREAYDAAPAALALPRLHSGAPGSLAEEVLALEPAAGAFGPCGAGPGSASGAVGAISDPSGPRVVVACAEGGPGEEAALVSALRRAAPGALVAYVRDGAGGGGVGDEEEAATWDPRRALGEVSALGYDTCDALCQTQVAVLMGLVFAAVALTALLCGLSQLAALDAPSRFEGPKDAATRGR